MRGDRQYRKRLLRLTTVAVATTVLVMLVGLVVLPSAIYAHRVTHPGCGDTGLTPGQVGIDGVEDVTYLSHDGLTLRAWYLPPENGVVIILLPGLGGSRSGMLRESGILARHGYGLLMTELRSCPHPQHVTTLGYLEALDLSEAVSWTLDQPEVDHVGALGYSMGGVTAILGAARDPRIGAVVGEGGFHDLVGDITNQGQDVSLVRSWISQWVILFFRCETGVRARDVSPISVVADISPRPLLLIYGDREEREALPRELLARAREPKELWIVPDCGHGEYLSAAPEEWEERVVAFFDRYLLQKQSRR